MAKRFADTDLWDKDWFMSLPMKGKLLIKFLFSKCDVAGVWTPNYTLASAYVGAKISKDDLATLKGQVEILPNGSIFIPEFIPFQYGKLSKDCKPHLPIFRLLEKHGLSERVSIGYPKGIHTLEEKEKEKDKEKEEEKEMDKEGVQGGNENPPVVLSNAEKAIAATPNNFSPAAIEVWLKLCKTGKWKKKEITALEISIKRLCAYDSEFAIDLMEKAISGGYQGVTFGDTDEQYDKWQKNRSKPAGNNHGLSDKELQKIFGNGND